MMVTLMVTIFKGWFPAKKFDMKIVSVVHYACRMVVSDLNLNFTFNLVPY